MKRTLILFLALITLFTACGAAAETAPVRLEDWKVSWDDAYTDIIALYGEPAETLAYVDTYILVYHDVTVCGMEGYSQAFEFAFDSNALVSMGLYGITGDAEENDRAGETLVSALTEQYGEPDEAESDNGVYTVWRSAAEDTEIRAGRLEMEMTDSFESYVSYVCTLPDEARKIHGGSPVTPVPVTE